MRDIDAVLFDLDGTLADTAPDLAHALNTLLAEEGRQPIGLQSIRPHVSHGGAAMVGCGFGLAADHPDTEVLRQRLLRIYRERLCHDTTLFTGMNTVLSRLEQANIKWGVVTNKPAFLTEPLMVELGLDQRAACVVSGDTTTHRKPHPEPLLHACSLAGAAPENCIAVGDAQRDIEAGRRAGMTTLVALFGYIGDADDPQDWGADGLISTAAELLEWADSNG